MHRASTHLEPGGIAADEPNVIAHRAQVLAAAGREVVQHGDLRAVAHEAFDEMRADESRTAGDEVSHAGPVRHELGH